MGRGQQRDAEKERRWRRLVTEWRQSGLSVREFCDWQALSEPSFYAWRRELAKRERERNCRHAQSVNGPGRAATKRAAFLPVQVVTDDVASAALSQCLEVRLTSGVQLRVPAGFDSQTLAQVLAALEKNRC